jgi:ABC-type transport system involved in multi-copper enzyme maturation permease subunit
MIRGLIRGEWLKVRRLGITWLMIGVPTVLAMLGSTLPIFGAAQAARSIGFDQFGGFQEFFFPQAAIIGIQLVDFLGGILLIMFITAVVGNEYRFDTWKTLLTRRAGRARFLLVKMGYALGFSTLILILAPLVFQLGANFTLKSALDIDVPIALNAGEGQQLLVSFGVTWLRLEIAVSIGLLTSIVARSAGGALTIGLPWLMVDGLANSVGVFPGFFRDIAPFTFNRNLDALGNYLQGGSHALSPIHISIVLLIYTVGVAALAIALFRRRDIAG